MRVGIISFTANGSLTAERIRAFLAGNGDTVNVSVKRKGDAASIMSSLGDWAKEQFEASELIVFVGATGIAVRAIAPFVKSKDSDPAVLCVDERGTYVISLLSGHIGGANEYAEALAHAIGAIPVVTTATDLNGKWAVDTFARKQGLHLSDLSKAKQVSAKILAGEQITFFCEDGWGFLGEELLNSGLTEAASAESADVVVGAGKQAGEALQLYPDTVIGIGCRKETEAEAIREAFADFTEKNGIIKESIKCIASIDLKKDEKGILALSEREGIPFITFSPDVLENVPGEFTPSDFVKNVTGVDNVCDRSVVAAGGSIMIPKTKYKGITFSAGQILPTDAAGALEESPESGVASNSQIVWKNQKALRTGYTTGSCAAAAAKAAARMLLSGEEVPTVYLMTPAGIGLTLETEEVTKGPGWVSLAIRKDSGDDPDVTNGVPVFAKVTKKDSPEITIDGGIGIGRVTRPGLWQKVGEAAINRVPRQMILAGVTEVCRQQGYEGGLDVVISIPKGVELAEKTFNPRLGIEGGISVLGTTGIVDPMSEKALTETIKAEMRMLHGSGLRYCYVVPGNYGMDFMTGTLGFEPLKAVTCSNYVGEAIDYALEIGMKGILFIGHAGKLLKLAAGVMNTHSRYADGRTEVLASHAALCGADRETVSFLMNCITTEEAILKLKEIDLLGVVMDSIFVKIEDHLRHRAGKELQIGAILFTNETGVIGRTSQAEALAGLVKAEDMKS